MRPKRNAAQAGTASLTHLYQSTIGVAPDGTLKATLSPSAFQPSEASAPLDDFAFGSILRIRLKNFQKYSECTIRPGPHMNMVLGPNGTGKSTLVAAIALGLGFPTSVLGRSNDIKEFIRHGQDKSFIELVLKTGSDPQLRGEAFEDEDSELYSLAQGVYSRPFITIRRVISNLNGKAHNEWFLNDSPVNHRLIQQLARILRAQVDNMCQFLPQDKVGDFVKMNPMQMLEATQEAAAQPGTLQKHQRLIELRQKDREIEAGLERDRRQMREDEAQVNALQERKRAAQEARDRVERLRNLRQKRPWLKYKQLREDFVAKKEARNAAKERLERETLELNADLQTQMASIEEQQKSLAKQKRAIDTQRARLRASIEREIGSQSQRSVQIENLKAAILSKRSASARNRQQAERCRDELREMDEVIREKQAELEALNNNVTDPEGSDSALKRISMKLREAQHERDQITAVRDALKEEGTRHQTIIHEATLQLQKLDDHREQKRERLRSINIDAYRALQWLDSDGNRGKFRAPVIGPLCLEIAVKPNNECPEMARMVESCISRQLLVSFVVTDRNDHELFMRECCDRGNLRINCILMPELERLKHTCPWKPEDLKAFGFDGVLLDALQGSPSALQALCEVAFIHKIPFCLGAADERLDMRACEQNPNLMKFVARDNFFELRRSRYAPNEVANRCSPLKQEMYLSSARDAAGRQDLIARIDAARQQQARLEREMHQKLNKSGNLDAEIEALRKQQSVLTEAKRARTAIVAMLNAKREARDSQKRRLRELVRKAADFDESEEQAQVRDLLSEQARSFAKIQQLQSEFNAVLMTAVDFSVKEQCLSLQQRHLAQILERNSSANEALRIALQQAENAMIAAKAAAEEALIEHQNSATTIDEKIFSELPDDLATIDREIAETEAFLQARGYRENQFTDVAEREYAARLASFNSVSEAVTLAEAEQAELRCRIRELAQEWRSAVDDVIIRVNDRFGQLFASINCRGSVELGVPANELDFDRYELAIKVAFRTGEVPQLLGTRQSGGERSVSTMLYLLSFQNLARAPLRVVDEINQGMDEEYERRVYALIVETATRALNSQYFLISPKLLKGLEYSDRMRILFVYNGVGVPSILSA